MSFTGVLRPYQRPVVERMVDRGLFLVSAGVGTGKTPMTIAAVEELHEEFGDDFAGVWVTGGGLKDQTAQAISQFTGGTKDEKGRWIGGAPCIVIDGPPVKRMELYQRAQREHPRYVVLGYDQVVDDHSEVIKLNQMYCVVDEVTVIKNPAAGITQAIRETFGESPFRFGLTGTPAENGRCDEVFQLLAWIDDSVFGRADLFDKTFCRRNKYGKVEEYINLPLFNEMLSDVSVSLDADDPGVREYMPTMSRPTRVRVEFDAESAKVYQRMSRDLEFELAELSKKSRNGFDLMAMYAGDSADAEAQGKIMSKISCMRMLCAHPDQIIGSAQRYLEQLAVHDADPDNWPMITKTIRGKKKRVPKPLDGSAYAAELYVNGVLDGLDETPKMDEVQLDIDDVLAGVCKCCQTLDGANRTNKVVVFSYHKLALRILEQRFGNVAVRYDGDMSLKKRNANKHRFKTEPGVRLFLTSDAGGYGVDLPEANHLFNLDIPFTAGRVTQRNARVRRANLEFHDAVHVRNYVIEGSLEEYYAELTEQKQRVANAMRTGRGTVKGGIVMNAGTLGMFLATHSV